jgi:hypothetical protein
MILELIAAIAAGGLAAGIVLMLNKLTGNRLPRWLLPVAAGLAIIAFAIRMEYTWFDRTTNGLPSGAEVAVTNEVRQIWRPWTFLWPVTNRFIAVDTASVISNENAPDLLISRLLIYGRWATPRIVPMAYDCADRLTAPLLDDVGVAEDGSLSDAQWAKVADDDPTLDFLCNKED